MCNNATLLSALLVLCAFGIGPSLMGRSAQAQDVKPATGQAVQITLKDGSRVIGTIEGEEAETIHFRTATGVEMAIPRGQVAGIEVLRGSIVGGRYLRVDPHHTRLFFAPTARSLGSGEGYIALYEIFLPYVSVGLADVASLGGGISLIPGVSEQLLYGAAKLTLVERPGMALAAGGFAATVTGEDGAGGLVFGTGTFGQSDAALTVGLAFAFGNGEFDESPVLLVGGEYQVSNNIKLLSENYIVPEVKGGVIVSGGIRFIGERLSADFGLFTSPEWIGEAEGFPFLPWISFSYAFGGRR